MLTGWFVAAHPAPARRPLAPAVESPQTPGYVKVATAPQRQHCSSCAKPSSVPGSTRNLWIPQRQRSSPSCSRVVGMLGSRSRVIGAVRAGAAPNDNAKASARAPTTAPGVAFEVRAVRVLLLPSGSAIRRLGHDADAVVVVAGSNDAQRLAAGQVTPRQVRGWIESALDALSGVECVVWANVATGAPTIYWSTSHAPALVNAVLADQAARRPNVDLVDWAATAAEPALLLADGLHHTVAGETRSGRRPHRGHRRLPPVVSGMSDGRNTARSRSVGGRLGHGNPSPVCCLTTYSSRRLSSLVPVSHADHGPPG